MKGEKKKRENRREERKISGYVRAGIGRGRDKAEQERNENLKNCGKGKENRGGRENKRRGEENGK